jgi:putative flippase GtrA
VLKKQIINFIIVGVVNTVFGYTLYSLFIYLGLNYVLSVLFATILGILFNFKSIGKFVFSSDDNKLIVKFFLVYVVVFFINILVIKYLKEFGFNDYISGLFAIIPASITSFVLNKYLVFKE